MSRSFRWQLLLALGVLAALPQPGRTQGGANLDQMVALERQDFGVAPTKQLHAGAMHGPTPASIPGAQLITTKGLIALVQGRQAPFVLFDVLGSAESLPGAVAAAWLAQPGAFNDAVQPRATQLFSQATQGRKDVALVFYCASRECWMSYNAALRAIHAGYTNVLWYRGGLEAWKAAGLATQPGAAPMEAQSNPAGAAPPGRAAPPAQPPGVSTNAAFVPVQPLARGGAAGGGSAGGARPAGELRIGQTQYFSFAMPPGWRIGEEGPYALTLLAPDNGAMTLMVGNAGMPLNTPPAQFAWKKLSALNPQNLQLGTGRAARPAAGFGQAVEFDAAFALNGVPHRAVAKVSVAPAYDSATMALTTAIARADQWAGYAQWLPQVANQVSATNGAAFGMRGIMQQNLRNSIAFGEAAKSYRDWSQKNWQQVTDERNASNDRRNFAVRENLGGVQTFASPYGTPPVELPMTHKYYWTDRQGRIVGTDDPSANPNTGSTSEWRKMERAGR